MSKSWFHGVGPAFFSTSLALSSSACGGDDAAEGSGSNGATMSAGSTGSATTQTDTSDTSDSQGDGTSTSSTDAASSTDSASSTSSTDSGDTSNDGDSTGDEGDTTGTGSTEGEGSTGDETGNPVTDQDGDGIPDDDDPFPNDPDLPGTVSPNLIYAHSSSVLWTMGVNDPYPLQQVGTFSYQSNSGQMTDIAIDQWGVLYGTTFNDLFVCHPQDAMCYRLAGLPQSFNGLTMIPQGFIEPDKDVLVAIANSGAWYRVDLVGPQMADLTQIGSYGNGYTSAGDAFSILGVGTYAAVNAPNNASNVIVEVDPADGSALSELATVTGYSTIYGLAGWSGSIFAFDQTGAVLRIDPGNGDVETIHANAGVAWWGAGVGTILPQ